MFIVVYFIFYQQVNSYKFETKDGKVVLLLSFMIKVYRCSIIDFYRLPRRENIQASYRKKFHTAGVNWINAHICTEHWSKAERENTGDLPDVPAPGRQLAKIKLKFINAKNVIEVIHYPELARTNQNWPEPARTGQNHPKQKSEHYFLLVV